jgi:uncharacterized membrane protein HdeD (DUF308 family)
MRRQQRLFLTRGLIAIAWAILFMAVAGSLTTGVAVLLVIYPLIDVVGSALDARRQIGQTRHVLRWNAALSTAAAIALGVAATGDVANVLVVFGLWALLAGLAELFVTIRRQGAFGRQWPLLWSSIGSGVLGIIYLVMAGGSDPKLRPLAYYGLGGVEFVLQAWLLSRRDRKTRPLVPRGVQ